MSSQDCARCRMLGDFEDHVRDLPRRSPAEFFRITVALYAYVENVIRDHGIDHDMEPEAMARRKAMDAKEIEVIGRTLWGHKAPDEHRFVIDGVKCGCHVCMDALVKKARETPIFTPEDIIALDAAVKKGSQS